MFILINIFLCEFVSIAMQTNTQYFIANTVYIKVSLKYAWDIHSWMFIIEYSKLDGTKTLKMMVNGPPIQT